MSDHKALVQEMFNAIAAGGDVDAAIDILQFRGDQCVAHWGVMDMAGALAQMGAGSHA
jgi:hypothetical protein